MSECFDEESCGSTGRIEDRLMFLRIHNIHEELDNMSRRTELARISLTSHDREEVFEGIPELLRVVIVEPVDLSEEHYDCISITEWEIGILENLLEKIRKMICLRELVESLDIEVGTILVRELGIEELRPGIPLIVTREKARDSSELLTRTILVIHELVDECIGDLINLSFWIRDFSDEDISTGVDTVFGNGSEHKKFDF